MSAALVDAETGRVYDMPFRILGMLIEQSEKGRDYIGPVYRLKSRLFIVDGCPEDDKCGTYYYEWQDHGFKLIRFRQARKPPNSAYKENPRTLSVFLRALCGRLLVLPGRLEDRERRALGVGDNRPGAHAFHRLGRHKNLGT